MAQNLDIKSILRDYPPHFESRPTYSSVGDCVELYFEDADHHAERIDCWLTVYKAFDDQRLIGFKLKNIEALLSAFDALGLDCRVSGKKWDIRLSAMIEYFPWVEPTSATLSSYRDLLTHVTSRSQETFELAHA